MSVARQPARGPAPVESVAVLPFEIIGPADAETVALREGLAADLGSRLSRSGVCGSRRVRRPERSAGQPVREIGRRLGVDMVLEGSIQHTADRVARDREL